MDISVINSKRTQPVLSTPTLSAPASSKTNLYARKAFMVTFVPFFVLLTSALGSSLTLGVPQICRLISKKNKAQVNQKIEQRRKEYLLTIMPKFEHMDENTLLSECASAQERQFIKKVLQIHKDLPTLPMEILYKKLQTLFLD